MRPHPLLVSILASLSGCIATQETIACFQVDAEATTCPSQSEVNVEDLWIPYDCDLAIADVRSDGARDVIPSEGGELPGCCYTVGAYDPTPMSDCVVGRPYRENGRVLVAPCEGAADEVAAAWARAAAGEHASVAAFAALALQLLHHGAPMDLLLAVSEAQADEVRHTQRCLEEAHRLGSKVALGAFPFSQPVNAAVSLADLAASAVREGCVAETLAAHLVSEAAAHTKDPRVRELLTAIATDEARHAVLSWRIVGWAVAQGGAEVREAVRGAFAASLPQLDVAELSLRTGVDAALLARAVTEAAACVVRPAARVLLAA